MQGIKIFLFYILLTVGCVQSESMEEDETQEMPVVITTSLPIILQLSESMKPNENKILQPQVEISTRVVEDELVLRNISNEVEVFKDEIELQKENQEDASVTESELEVEPQKAAEESTDKEEEPEEPEQLSNEPEDATVAEEEGETAHAEDNQAETEKDGEPITDPKIEESPKTDVEPESEKPMEEEVPLEPEAEKNQENHEPEKENVQPDEVSNPSGGLEQNNESEMSNDEPAKEEENVAKGGIITTTENEAYCFACSSTENSNCSKNGTKQITCSKVNEGDAGKHNGCYTLFKVETNITMRGCVDDLAEGGLNYCLKNEKLCNMCYSNNCNNKMAPGKATKLQLNIFTLLFFTTASMIFSAFENFTIK